MSDKQRPDISKKNPYWLERHRYYELKHFCLQYSVWKKARAEIEGLVRIRYEPAFSFYDGSVSDPTFLAAERRLYLTNRIEMVEQTARDTDPILGSYILRGVTEGCSYDVLNMRERVPCCKDIYYELYRRFFWLLDKVRK